MKPSIHISRGLPEVAEYLDFRNITGDPPLEKSAAEAALAHSLFGVVVRNEASELIGMGRVVGDGVMFFQMVDLRVRPGDQEAAIAGMMVEELLSCLRDSAPKDAEVTVITDVSGIKLYQSAGFRLLYPERYGMAISLA